MGKLIQFLLIGYLFLELVSGQRPHIVGDILPESQPVGGTARLNCTVFNKLQHLVIWEHAETGHVLSFDEKIDDEINNPVVDGEPKFEIETRGVGRGMTYMLVIRRLEPQDAGNYTCLVKIPAEDVAYWPMKDGQLFVKQQPLLGKRTASNNYSTSVVYTATGTLTFALCEDNSTMTGGTCHNAALLPFGFALPGTDPSPYSLQNVLYENDDNFTKALCSHTATDTYLCSYSSLVHCKPKLPMATKMMMPTEQRLHYLQKLICGHRQDYDAQCVQTRMDELQSCANISDVFPDDIDSIPVSQYGQLMTNTSCRHYALGRSCVSKTLMPCGLKTAKLFLGSIHYYKECEQLPDMPAPVIDCSSQETELLSYMNCFPGSDTLLDLQQLQPGDDVIQHLLITSMLQKNKARCSNLQDFADGVKCALEVKRRCVSKTLRPTVPDTHTVITGLAKFCQNIHDFNVTCAMSSIKDACSSRRKRATLQEKIFLKYLCQETRTRNNCEKTLVDSCGARTSRIFHDLIQSQLPSMCLHNGAHLPDVIG